MIAFLNGFMYVICVALIAVFFLTILGITFRIGWISGILSVVLGTIAYIFMRIPCVMVSHLIFQAANVSCEGYINSSNTTVAVGLTKCLQDRSLDLSVHNWNPFFVLFWVLIGFLLSFFVVNILINTDSIVLLRLVTIIFSFVMLVLIELFAFSFDFETKENTFAL